MRVNGFGAAPQNRIMKKEMDELTREKRRQQRMHIAAAVRIGALAFSFGLGFFAGNVTGKREGRENALRNADIIWESQAAAGSLESKKEPEKEQMEEEEKEKGETKEGEPAELPDWIIQDIIPVHGESRRQVPLEGVKDIVIHYVGNPGTTAKQNRDWFANPESEVSSHFVVGLEGEIIQCVPLDEKSSATNWRNKDTISIESCHPDSTGKYNQATYDSLVKLTAWLCDVYGLDSSHVIRHYDVTEKICPKYFVEHEDAWEQFLEDVEANK